MNFCFWNINKKNLSTAILNLVEENQIDLLFLAENDIPPSNLLRILNEETNSFFYVPGKICDKIQIFARFKDQLVGLLQESRRITGRQLYSPVLSNNVTLICLHYQSKVNWNDQDQAAHIMEIKLFVDGVENLVNHKRTVIFGDFNMHPFDIGLIQSTGLHTTMEKNIARRQSRTIDGKEYNFLYNPMWGFLGDLGKGKVSGTIYYSPAKPINFHWNLFDQVLLRPEIMDLFDANQLDIITSIKGNSLLTSSGQIDANLYSDHLPIKFTLHI